jgi:hypothetical protein
MAKYFQLQLSQVGAGMDIMEPAEAYDSRKKGVEAERQILQGLTWLKLMHHSEIWTLQIWISNG